MELNALCNTVMSAWGEFESVKLENVYERWKLVLDLIIKDNGGDRLIKANRGKLYREPYLEVDNHDKETTRCAADDTNLTPEDIHRKDRGLD